MDESLSFESLYSGAQKFADLALRAHRDEDEEVFVLHAGVSIERLLKAALAKVNPVLLMETGALKDDRALLHFTGVRPSGEKVRTVSSSQALARIRSAGWLQKDAALDGLIELRNGVAHLGHTKSEGNDVLLTFGSTTNQLLTHLDIKPEAYWGDWHRTIEISLNEQLEMVEREFQRRVEQAKHRLEQRLRPLPLEAAEAYIASNSLVVASVNTRSIFVQINMPHDCPACGHTGTITTGPPVLIHKDRPAKADPNAFNCGVCGLHLWAKDLLAAAGMSDRVSLLDEEGKRLLSVEDEIHIYRTAREEILRLEEQGFTTP